LGVTKSRCSSPDADGDWIRRIGWPGWIRSADEGWARLVELAKLVGYSGNLFLDGEFDSPPPPPANSAALPPFVHALALSLDADWFSSVQNKY
jgi:hypothetical protein